MEIANSHAKLLVRILLLLSVSLQTLSIGAQSGVDFELEENFTITSKGVVMDLPFFGDLNLYSPGDEQLNVKVNGRLQLGALNAKLKDILKNTIEEVDECGDCLYVNGARITSIANGKAYVSIDLTFEQWLCASPLKTRISQSGNVLLEVTPQPKHRGIDFVANVQKVEASGLLRSLIENSSLIRREVVDLIQRELPEAMGMTLSDEFKDIPVFEIRSVAFQSGMFLAFDLFAQAHRDVLMEYIIKYR